MGKIVDILNLPSNYLLITKSEILYKKGKKQFTFKISEIKYEFHSFFEDFESLSQLVIFSSDITYYVNNIYGKGTFIMDRGYDSAILMENS